jgi:hypothetical protein
VWAQVKWEVTKKNKTFSLEEVERLVNVELDGVMHEDWGFVCKT